MALAHEAVEARLDAQRKLRDLEARTQQEFSRYVLEQTGNPQLAKQARNLKW